MTITEVKVYNKANESKDNVFLDAQTLVLYMVLKM